MAKKLQVKTPIEISDNKIRFTQTMYEYTTEIGYSNNEDGEFSILNTTEGTDYPLISVYDTLITIYSPDLLSPHIKTSKNSRYAALIPNTTSWTANKTIATEDYVDDAIAALPEPMIFKGSVGSGGTAEWANLPVPGSTNEGFTYKVITEHSTAPICKVGDTIISNGSSWIVIPSGDEPSGTVTSVSTAAEANSGLTLTGGPITSSGTIIVGLDSGYELLNSNTDQTIDGKKWFSSQATFQSGFNSPGYSTIYQTDIFGRITHASSGGYTQYGLTVPSTSGWTADKTIATTEDIAQVLNLGTISFNSSNEAETSEPLVVALFDALSISGSPVLVKFSTSRWTGSVSDFSMPASFAFSQTLSIRYLYGNVRVSTSADTGFQISIYHKGGSASNTLTIKATQIPLDSSLVHKTGDETISGIKKWKSKLIFLPINAETSTGVSVSGSYGSGGDGYYAAIKDTSDNTIIGFGAQGCLFKKDLHIHNTKILNSYYNSTYGLILPNTASWTVDKTIATTDQLPTNYVTTDSGQVISGNKIFNDQTDFTNRVNIWGDAHIATIKNGDGNYGLLVPPTTTWTADKTIAIDENVAHKGTAEHPISEDIYGTKRFKNWGPNAQSKTIESLIEPHQFRLYRYDPSTNADGINATISAIEWAPASTHYFGLGIKVYPDQDDEVAYNYGTLGIFGSYKAGQEKYLTLGWYTRYGDEDEGTDTQNYYFYDFPHQSGTVALDSDLVGKVSKTGDTMTGDLQLNVGSGYSLSPKLVFVNHGGNGYLYKDNDNLILNHVGSSSNYTLTFPAKTANIATTTKTVIVHNSGYSPEFTYASLDVEYYDEDNNANTIRLAEGESTTINCVAWCLKRVNTVATAEPVLGLYSGIVLAGANSSIYRQIQSGSMYITVPITDWDGIVLPVTETSTFECYHAVARKA